VLEALVDAVSVLETPAVVGLSGRGGAGKSSLCRELVGVLPRVAVVAGDDFLDPAGCAAVTDDWRGLDRARIARELIGPFHRGDPVRWQRMDWGTGSLAEWHELPPAEVLVVEGIGVVHPALAWDLTVWLEVDAEVALRRGIRRDRDDDGVDVEAVWREVWGPTDDAFIARFRPAETADLVLRP
jgi:uridine kinase